MWKMCLNKQLDKNWSSVMKSWKEELLLFDIPNSYFKYSDIDIQVVFVFTGDEYSELDMW